MSSDFDYFLYVVLKEVSFLEKISGGTQSTEKIKFIFIFFII